VALHDGVLGEGCALELAVDVGGEDEGAAGHALGPAAKDLEAFVGGGVSIQVEAMTIEAPCDGGVAAEPFGGGLAF
jgi:hypothetical protein